MRSSGILLHITSLPSPYGVGTMGKETKRFLSFLRRAGQTNWQILPVCPTSFGDSPYQSFSTFAGNPYLLDLDMLCEEGLLLREEYDGENWGSDPVQTDFGLLYAKRWPLFRKAFARFVKRDAPADYADFCERQRFWLEDFALFMALKDAHDGAPWYEWEEPLRFREPEALEEARQTFAEDIAFHHMLQYLFFRQWRLLRACARENGVRIIGDLPIYVADDSVDVWAHPAQFLLDEARRPIEVAGCPPDGFTAGGQLWGNPIYRWDEMERDGYRWWIDRVGHLRAIYDVLRIDHFRGFESYYAVPAGAQDARYGEWRPGPGLAFFQMLERTLGPTEIIAEDLGYLTEEVRQLRRNAGFPGMKVLQFAFDSREESDYLPHRYERECVVYTGTHDNDTSLGWLEHAPPEDVQYAKEYLRLTVDEGYHWGMMKAVWSSVGNLAIVPMQDVLGLGSDARMNIPSTTGGRNWRWRAQTEDFSDALAEKLYHQMELYDRLP